MDADKRVVVLLNLFWYQQGASQAQVVSPASAHAECIFGGYRENSSFRFCAKDACFRSAASCGKDCR